MLKRSEYTRIFCAADTEALSLLARPVREKHTVRLLKPAQKTLTMIEVREPVQASLFYLGEALCCECLVDVDGQKGFAVIMGDDFEKATAAAILDAVFRADMPQREELEKKLLALEEESRRKRGALNKKIMQSKVRFDAM